MIFVVLSASALLTQTRWIHYLAMLSAVGVATAIIPFQVSASTTVVLWSALALVPLFLRGKVAEIWTGYCVEAALIGVLAWIVVIGSAAPADQLFDALPRGDGSSLLGGSLLALLALAGASASAAYLLRRHPLMAIPLASAFGAAAYLVRFETGWATTVAGWSALVVAAVLLSTQLKIAQVSLRWIAALIGVLAWIVVIGPAAPADQLFDALPRGDGSSLLGGALLALLALAGASATAAYLLRRHPLMAIPLASAFGAAAYLVRFETSWAATVAGWSVLAIVAVLLEPRLPIAEKALRGTLVVLLAAGIQATLSELAPVERLFVDATSTVDHPFLWSGATLALGALAIAMYAVYQRVSSWRYGWAALAASGGLAVYMVSVAVVDHFQAETGGTVDLETLDRRAQVALSILWAVCGGIAFAFGIMRRKRPARVLGLGLLGAATTKVFIYDLAFLNTSYRVLSFIGLGMLLLASSYLYQRLIEGASDAPEDLLGSDSQPPSEREDNWPRGGHGGWFHSHRLKVRHQAR